MTATNDLPENAAIIREVRGITDLIRASADQVVDEDAGRAVDQTAMIAWKATHGRYEFSGSMEDVQEQVSQFLETKSAAMGSVIVNLALWVASLEPEMSFKDIIDEVERRVLANLAAGES